MADRWNDRDREREQERRRGEGEYMRREYTPERYPNSEEEQMRFEGWRGEREWPEHRMQESEAWRRWQQYDRDDEDSDQPSGYGVDYDYGRRTMDRDYMGGDEQNEVAQRRRQMDWDDRGEDRWGRGGLAERGQGWREPHDPDDAGTSYYPYNTDPYDEDGETNPRSDVRAREWERGRGERGPFAGRGFGDQGRERGRLPQRPDWQAVPAWQKHGPATGLGPRGYQRRDESICDEICDRLTRHGWLDASDVDVTVENGEVTLRGRVNDRRERHTVEDTAEAVSGVRHVNNELRVKPRSDGPDAPLGPGSFASG